MAANICGVCGMRVAGDEDSDEVGHARREQCIASLRAEVDRLASENLRLALFDDSRAKVWKGGDRGR